MKAETEALSPRPTPSGMVPVTYLTMDEIARGVGASQVLPYVEGLARRGVRVTLHSFEHTRPSAELRKRVDSAGVAWHPHHFRHAGSTAGAARVLQGAGLVSGRAMVHARSDLAAASALLGRPKAWVWDVRSFWADQRVAMGLLRPGSTQERMMRTVEASAAARASGITTLTAAAINLLAERYGEAVRSKATVIPTCVDMYRFSLASTPDTDQLQLLLSGSFNQLYDLDLTLRFFRSVQKVRPAALTLLRPSPSPWDGAVVDAGGSLASARFADMPNRVRASHAGLSICRTDDRAAIAGAAPTKIAEFLATGRPVVVNAGLGDMDDLIAEHRCGVVVRENSDEGLDRAARSLGDLVDDVLTPTRCQAVAAEHFDIEKGVSRLLDVYETCSEPSPAVVENEW